MASIEDCLTALEHVLGDLAANPAAAGLDRSLSCRLTDLRSTVRGRLREGAVHDLHVVAEHEAHPKADIRFTMTSDDLMALTGGELAFGPAWLTGRIKLEAGLRDLLRLRSLL